jgi:outer membrane protein assembly factor BamB
MRPRKCALPFILALTAYAALSARAEDWPNWRGPTGLGLSSAKDLPLTWGGPKDENIRWKAPLLATDDKVRLDNNQSSPIVQGGRVFVTMSYWPSASTVKEYPEHHVLAFDADSGKRLWDEKVPPGPWLLSDLRGGYTAPTPAADAERVYVLFGSAVFAALDHQGKLLWRKEITPFAFDVCLGTSPVLYKDTVLVICEMTKGSRLIAFDKATGDIRWSRDRKGADWTHSTPVIAKIEGKEQMLVAGANALQGLDPATGEILWSAGLADQPKARIGDAPTPAYGAGIVYADSGRGGPGLAVDPTGTGDVSKTHGKWKSPNVQGDSLGSPLVVGDYLYRLQAPGILKCFKMPAGDLMYTQRLQEVATASSPVATADDRIFLATAGKSYVLRAGPTFEVLGTSSLGDASQSSPAIANERLYLRGQKNLYCIAK